MITASKLPTMVCMYVWCVLGFSSSHFSSLLLLPFFVCCQFRYSFGIFYFFIFLSFLSSVCVRFVLGSCFSHSGFQCRIKLPLLLVLFVWRRKNIWVTRGGSNFRVSAYGEKLHNVTLAFAEISMVITVWWILKQVQNSEKELICNTKSTTIL